MSGFIAWARAVIVAVFAIGCVRWIVLAVAEQFTRASRVIEDARKEIADTHDARALAIVCEPCSGNSGRCTCSRKCGHWLCGAADTGVKDWTDDEIKYLRGELKELPRG